MPRSAGKKPHRRLIVHLRGERTEGIPVEHDFELPHVSPNEVFVYIEAADGSEVCFRQEDILTLHLKD